MIRQEFISKLTEEDAISIANNYFKNKDSNPQVDNYKNIIVVTNSTGERVAIYPFTVHYKSAGGMQNPHYQTKQDAFVDFMITKFGKSYLLAMYNKKFEVKKKWDDYMYAKANAESEAEMVYSRYKMQHGMSFQKEIDTENYLADQALWFQLHETFYKRSHLAAEHVFHEKGFYYISAEEMHKQVLLLMEDIMNGQNIGLNEIIERTKNPIYKSYYEEFQKENDTKEQE